MTTNPLISARSLLHVTQQELATRVSLSQQLIQRYEAGQANSVSGYYPDYLTHNILLRDRRDILEEIIADGGGHAINDRGPCIPGLDPSYHLSAMYWIWVQVERCLLPDLSHLLAMANQFDTDSIELNKAHARVFIAQLSVALDLPEHLEENEQIYEIAKKIKVHPFVLTNFVKHANAIPPTVISAINGTRK